MEGNLPPKGEFVLTSISFGPVDPEHPPMTLEQITKNLLKGLCRMLSLNRYVQPL